MKESIASRVEALAQPVAEGLGYELFDVEYVKEGPDFFLRLYITKEEGIAIDDCEAMSRAIDPLLDEADLIKDHYYLEVSSPGLERVLRKQEHFAASVGSEIDIRLFAPDENKKKSYNGVLSAYDEESITIDIAEESRKIPLNKISKIQTVFDFFGTG